MIPHFKIKSVDPLGSVPSPAPVPALSVLVGREHEVALAMSILRRDGVRVLTLTGPGGIGKTRLAREVAHRLTPDYIDGTRFVPLAPVPSAELVPEEIARALGLQHAPTGNALVHTLRDANLLLVLDNVEHVLGAASLVVDLLLSCPNLKVLATSRALLRVTGEHALPVPPLALPPPGDIAADEVAGAAAVRLFVDRAQAVVPAFALTAANAPVIAAICRRMDGLPLAIELAAAQVGVLPPAALMARIDSRLPLPFGGPRDAPDRHRTMRSAVAWSYALLPADEQQLFRYLGVFTGGFELAAAAAVHQALVSAAGAPAPVDTLVPLATLADKSLVRQEALDGEARFSLLETVRVIAVELLADHGEQDAAQGAHAAWCLALAECHTLAPLRPDGVAQLSRLELEHANLRAALEWFAQQGDAGRLLRLVSALSGFWYAHGHYREGISWLERALASAPAALARERAPALVALGRFLRLRGDFARAGNLLAQGVATLRDKGDAATLTLGLIGQGANAVSLGDHEQAEAVLDEALGYARTIDDPSVAGAYIARALSNLGLAAHARGELELAATRYQVALRTAQENGYVLGAVRSLRDLGDVARDQGDYAGSVAYYRESVALWGERGDLRVLIDILEGSALAATVWDLPERAARLLGAADALGEQSGASAAMVSSDRVAHDRTVVAMRAGLSAPRAEAAWTAGRLLTVPEAIVEVLTLRPPTTASGRALDRSGTRLLPRERELLRMLAAGQTDREIAAALFLSVRTVEAHVGGVRAKLGVRTRTAAVVAAIAAGLVDPPSPD